MALYADENFPLRVVEELRLLGHDVLTAFEDGNSRRLFDVMIYPMRKHDIADQEASRSSSNDAGVLEAKSLNARYKSGQKRLGSSATAI